jgi:hypothetical protein
MSDFVPELKTVVDGFRGRIHVDRDAVDVMGFDSFRQPRAGQSYDPK